MNILECDGTLLDYWRRRLQGHVNDTYMGLGMQKFPEDLRMYEHLMYEMKADTVIELGVLHGGSTLWFRDRLWNLARYGVIEDAVVIAVDIRPNPGLPRDIIYIQGDIMDPYLPDAVAELLPPNARPFVVEDTAHLYGTTTAALEGFSRFVPPGGFYVVEDTVVDVEELRISSYWPRGVKQAIGDWLHTDQGMDFVVRYDLERYGVTCHPGGFLQRR